jgi:hypothetical protein
MTARKAKAKARARAKAKAKAKAGANAKARAKYRGPSLRSRMTRSWARLVTATDCRSLRDDKQKNLQPLMDATDTKGLILDDV